MKKIMKEGVLFSLMAFLVCSCSEQESAEDLLPRKVLGDVWNAEYFKLAPAKNGDLDLMYFESLKDGSSKNSKLVDAVWKLRCRDSSEACYVAMTAAGNILVDGGEIDTGLRASVEAYDRSKDNVSCPVIYELSILRYKLSNILSRDGGVSNAAMNILSKIKKDGGIVADLRGEVCAKFFTSKPQYFFEYAYLTSELMLISGGEVREIGYFVKRNLKKGGIYE